MNFDSVPFYNILCFFFVGVFFLLGAGFLFPELFLMVKSGNSVLSGGGVDGAAALVVLTYYAGFLIDRFGSLVVERILKNKKDINKRGIASRKLQMTWRKYSDYQRAEKNSQHIKTLAREYTFSRNSMTLFFIFSVLALIAQNWIFCMASWILMIFLYFSTKKHADKIAQRVDFYQNHKD